MEKFKDKKIVIELLIISTIVISIVGTYAYFLASVGETINEKLIVKAGTMQLVFKDTDELITNTETTLNFGDIVTKEFEIENTGTLPVYAKISWNNLVNTYLEESLTYTLEYKTKGSEEEWKSLKTTRENVPRSEKESKIVLADKLEIPSGITYLYKLSIKLEDLPDIDQTQDLGAILSTKFTLDEGIKPEKSERSLMNLNLKAKEPVEGVPDFSKIAITDETSDGLYSMEDDYGTSYYYRGAVNNNYVKFGQNASGQDMWWRIIRINGDGSIRMQYDGLQGWANGTINDSRLAIVGKAWNAQYGDAKYVGWMFGGAQGTGSKSYEEAVRNETNSDIKTEVDNWYIENIKNTGYEKYLSDEVFCNDRTAYVDTKGLNLGNGYGTLETNYGGYVRLYTKKKPSFKCPQENDMFTLKDEASPRVRRGKVEGNKALDYPVGLITADEISAAGGMYGSNNTSYYLYKTGSYYPWSLSPCYFNNVYARMFVVNTSGNLSHHNVYSTNGAAAPVINLSADYTGFIKGNGTIENPYELNI